MRNAISSIIALVLIIVVLTALSPKVRALVGNIIDVISHWFNLDGVRKYKNILVEKLSHQFDESKEQVEVKLPELKLDFGYWFQEIKDLIITKGEKALKNEELDLTK